MKIRYNPLAVKAFADAPWRFKSLLKQAGFLVQNLNHPSLRAKKYDEANDRWQARVNRNWRFYFAIEGDTYIILDIIPHPKRGTGGREAVKHAGAAGAEGEQHA